MKKIVETKILRHEDVREACIAHNWYNRGTNEEYSEMFHLWNSYDNMTVETLEKIAKNIMEHTSASCLDGWDVCSIMTALCDKSLTVYDEKSIGDLSHKTKFGLFEVERILKKYLADELVSVIMKDIMD